MKGAHHGPLALALRPIHHPRAAMTAQVVKGPHHPVLAAHDQAPFAQYIKRQPIARRGDVTDMARQLPMVQENIVLFHLEQFGAVIGPSGQATAVPFIGDGQGFKGQVVHEAS